MDQWLIVATNKLSWWYFIFRVKKYLMRCGKFIEINFQSYKQWKELSKADSCQTTVVSPRWLYILVVCAGSWFFQFTLFCLIYNINKPNNSKNKLWAIIIEIYPQRSILCMKEAHCAFWILWHYFWLKVRIWLI